MKHDAKASIYRINILNFIINQLICIVISYSMKHKQSKPIECIIIYV